MTSTNTQDYNTTQNSMNTNFANNNGIGDFTTQTLLILNSCNKMIATSNDLYTKSRGIIEEATSLMISARSTFKEASKLNYSKSSKVARFHNYTPTYYNNNNITSLPNGIPSIASSSYLTSSAYQSDCVDVISSPLGGM